MIGQEMGHGMGDGMGSGWWVGMGWGAWLTMFTGMVICLGLLVALVMWLARRYLTGSHASLPAGPTAEADATLDQRFARGEIGEDEYLRRKSLLSSDR